ncbi:GNAT family N-acetyltransferase [Pseudoroseomonas cervicalis]|uniref:GNAT family N-acetyltransferase n=1 Tax=Teichococcus cervicalis TaxID=204525 RepID=UPI00277E72A5|nr:GNAT family N-acetyltransferase [Pseudoroseomonas cervicalis]MDQ1081026.1 putative GNAT superfamily acetyltransferase [Pseudoroseomonas cervicalis]
MLEPGPILPAQHPALLALNNLHAEAVNALDAAGFAALCQAALWTGALWQGGRPLGFLIALQPGGPATGPNHGWMQANRPGAAYIDRVVVDAAAQGQGTGRALYAALAAAALQAGLAELGCEVNLDPPNPASMGFHTRLGFAPVGEATDPRNGKVVRYLAAPAAPLTAHFLRSPDQRPCPAGQG